MDTFDVTTAGYFEQFSGDAPLSDYREARGILAPTGDGSVDRAASAATWDGEPAEKAVRRLREGAVDSPSASGLEDYFAALLSALCPDLPAPEREFRFAPSRRWRFDFCWQEQKLAVEIEGGTRSGGRHNRAEGYTKDAEKYNAAAEAAWIVLRYTDAMIREDPAACLEQIERVFARLVERKRPS